MAVDASGDVYITGQTLSNNLPTVNAYDTSFTGSSDIYVAKLTLAGGGSSDLLYSTYLGGGTDFERSNGIAVDGAGKVYIVGPAFSGHPTTAGAFQTTMEGSSDAFLTVLDTNISGASGLVYSTYIGGSGSDEAEDVYYRASDGYVYIVGQTSSNNFDTTTGAYQETSGGGTDGFLAIINPVGGGASDLIYSTYLGGAGLDSAKGLVVDSSGVVHIVGHTAGGIPLVDPTQGSFGGGTYDAFVAKLNPAATGAADLTFSTFLGGSDTEYGHDIVVDSAGDFYVTGYTASSDYPTTSGAYDQVANSGNDAFIAKYVLNRSPTATSNSYTIGEGGVLAGNMISDNTGAGIDSDPDSDPLTASLVDGPLHGTLVLNGDGSFTYTPFDEPGGNFADTDTFTYQVNDGQGGTDTATVTITVTPDGTNDAPFNTVPGNQTVGQDLALVFSADNSNQIIISDDAGGNNIEVSLTATNGTVTLATTAGLSITAGADGSSTVTIQGTLTSLNTALDGLIFTPTASYLGAASLQVATDDLGNSPAGSPLTDTDTINIDVIAINDPPVNTVPGAQTIDEDGMLLFSTATGTAISISDPDAAGSDLEVTLTATGGTINLSGDNGLTFSVGDGTDDATMTFTGTISEINAALEGATFVATADFTGTASVQIVTNDQGNTGAGGAMLDTDTVTITVEPSNQQLWLTFENDEAGTGSTDIPSVTGGDVVTYGDITQLETSNTNPLASTTSGTFSYAFNLDTVKLSDGVTDASDGNTRVNAVHYVTRDMQVGTNNIQLYAGDLLLSTNEDESLGGVTYKKEDVFVFRADTFGDYSEGSFFRLIDGKNDTGYGNVTGITLVEQTTTVGGVTLSAGELLIGHDGSANDILRFTPGSLGDTTTGTTTLFLDRNDIDIDQKIGGIHLVQADTVIGGVSLTAGQLLVTLQGDDSAVGNAPTIDAPRQDIFVLIVTSTGSGTTAATADRFFEGANENLDNNNETIWGISYQGNAAPIIAADTFAIDENSAGGTSVGMAVGTDPEGGAVTYALIAGNQDGAFAIDANTGQITVANTAALDFETTSTFSLTVATIDPEGAFGTATITVNLNDVNEAPVLDNTGTMTLTGISEDDTSNGGDTVASIIASAGGDRITDVDAGSVEGLAITSLSSGNGTWQFSTNGGGSWTNIGSVSETSALLLRSTDLVRFVPDGQNASTASFDFRAWDQISGTAGNKVDVSVNGGETSFSSAIETASITVTDVNNAPVLDNAGSMQLANVLQNTTDPNGDSVATIISSAGGDRITDVDSGSLEGIAVTAVEDTNGTWQYSTNGGSTWNNFGSVSDASAVVLTDTASDLIRFVPDTGFTGTATITFRGWDTTDGNSSGTSGVNTTTNGGTTAYSIATETASVYVEPTEVLLWMSTTGDVGPAYSQPDSGVAGLPSWSESSLIGMGDPNLSFGAGTTDGTFSLVSNFDLFAGDGNTEIRGLHYVTSDITVTGAGISGGSVDFLSEDLIFVAGQGDTLTTAASGRRRGGPIAWRLPKVISTRFARKILGIIPVAIFDW